MGAGTSRRDGIITGINVTPLVDVVLVLLVILMVTSAYIASQTIPLDLPKGATGESQATTLAVSVDGRGAVFLDGEPVTLEALAGHARRARAGGEEARALIAADGDVSHRHVVRVIDTLRGGGVTRYAIQIQPEDAAP